MENGHITLSIGGSTRSRRVRKEETGEEKGRKLYFTTVHGERFRIKIVEAGHESDAVDSLS